MLRWLVVLLLAYLAGCATQSTKRRSTQVAVLKITGVGVDERTSARVRTAMQRTLVRTQTRATSNEAVDDVARDLPVCAGSSDAQQDRCASAAGRRLGASHVVVAAIGGLGRTFILKMRIHDVAKNAVVRSLEETRFGSAQQLPAAAALLIQRLFPTTRRSRAWYKRWWVWTAAAAVAAGVAVGVAVAVSEEQDPYDRVSLP